jgi:hypothetical protein
MPLTTAELLLNISPEDIGALSDLACAVAVFQDHLYLVTIDLNAEHSQEVLRIRRYGGQSNQWKEVYTTVLKKNEGQSVDPSESPTGPWPQEKDAYSCEILISQDSPTRSSALSICLFTPSQSLIVRSHDGTNFDIIAGATPRSLVPRSLQGYLNFQGRLYALLSQLSDSLASQDAEICNLCAATGSSLMEWHAITSSDFGDVNNQSISAITVFNDFLYAATINPSKGTQVWRTKGNPQQADTWEAVITNGATRYSLNSAVFAMTEFQGDLYIASGVPTSNSYKRKKLYSSGFELIRLYADQDWDLIVGTPRFTEIGLKVPLTALGPGFDDLSKQVVQFLISHNDALYLATQGQDGFQLWVTKDGESWSNISLQELSTIYQVKVRKALSTPYGLVLLLETTEPVGDQSLQIWCGR